MTFLQPWMLWGLAAASVPILIHLLNRLRYRTVRWGAMYFLRRVTRSAMRRSRLRHYLMLACRALALAMLALAMARPLFGGRLGAGLAGAPDAILVLLDRSASMERADPRLGRSRREQALALAANVPPESARGSRIVLIESARPEPLEIGDLAALPALDRAGPTDTAADAPALFESALAWLDRNRPGRAEIWVLTDGQTSNWKPDAPVWPGIAARLAAFTPSLAVQLLLVQGRSGENLAIQARELRRLLGPVGEHELRHALFHPNPTGEAISAVQVLNGERTVLPLPADANITEHALRLPAAGEAPLWGWIELPADENPRDNSAYFVCGRGPAGTVWARIADAPARRFIEAAFPNPPGAPPTLNPWPESGTPALDAAGLVIWQGPAPTGADAAALDAFLREGGAALALPPIGETEALPLDDAALAWNWGAEESAEAERPFRIVQWEPLDGPFARAADGRPLPLAEAAVRRRRTPALPQQTEAVSIAAFPEGVPLLLRCDRGAGRLYLLSTLPTPEWSDLWDGRIWIPALWRMREEGARRLSEIRMTRLGEPLPGGAEVFWETVGADAPRDPRIHAGVYRAGGRWVARNRPIEEDLPEEMTAEEMTRLLPGVAVRAIGDAGNRQNLYSEAVLPFLLLAGLFLATEAALALQDFSAAGRAGARERFRS